MYIVVGLGNPGNEYARTRHNVGFDVIDVIGEKQNIRLKIELLLDFRGLWFYSHSAK